MARSTVNTHFAARSRFLLVVDSNARNRLYTITLLQRFQYKIWIAQSASEAVEMATTAVPALIVTAQRLNDMPGLKLIHKLKQNPRARTVPIIVLTGKTDLADERACLSAGAVTCLPAPVQIEDLYRVVQMAIEPIPRMNIRINTKLPVTINNRAVECGDGACASVLSEHGVYVRTLDPYPLNTRLPVRIHLAGKALSAVAVVIYRHQAGNKRMAEPGMGLQFVQISGQDQERIRLFIRDEITRDIELP